MKFKLLTDLHLEFNKGKNLYKPTITDQDKNTTLLLAGDIHIGIRGKDWITEMCGQFANVIYILGNHEFYGNEYHTTINAWLDIAEMDMPVNFHFLHNDTVYLGDTRIIGGTMWTNFDHGDWFAMQNAKANMSDFHTIRIRKGGKDITFTPQDTILAFNETTNYIEFMLKEAWEGKTIIMTHHLPHALCVAKRFRGSILNGAFVTDLDYIFEGNDIDVWVHGHTHDNVDVTVHGTRILCNPRGYEPFAVNKEFIEDLTFDT